MTGVEQELQSSPGKLVSNRQAVSAHDQMIQDGNIKRAVLQKRYRCCDTVGWPNNSRPGRFEREAQIERDDWIILDQQDPYIFQLSVHRAARCKRNRSS
jgi:hypothetical protein